MWLLRDCSLQQSLRQLVTKGHLLSASPEAKKLCLSCKRILAELPISSHFTLFKVPLSGIRTTFYSISKMPVPGSKKLHETKAKWVLWSFIVEFGVKNKAFQPTKKQNRVQKEAQSHKINHIWKREHCTLVENSCFSQQCRITWISTL